jgi:YVTN family beta-propeller protein
MFKPFMFKTLAAAALALTGCGPALAADAAPMQVLQRFTLEGASKWDYATVDAKRHRLFVTRGDRVEVLDTESGKTVGTIGDTPGVHGVALVEELGLGFTSNGANNTLAVFGLDDLKPQGQIAIQGRKPDALYYEPVAHKLYVFNGDSNNLNVIDPAARKLVAVVAAPGAPEFAAADGEGHVLFNIEDKARIAVLDQARNKVVRHRALAGCEGPTGLAIDTAHHRAFSSCQNHKLVVTDTRTLKTVAEVGIGAHPDAVIFDAGSGRVFVSNGDDASLSVISQIDADHYRAEAPVATEKGAKTMAMDASTGRIYLPTGKSTPFTVVVVGAKP